ncbi:MAG: ABC transporter ATP-binding protein [Clostridia bacterium]|nr:ABC transporter ATP-binding protein [Clostridia bacterium]
MIEVKHLTKKYGNHEAVSDLSFTIEDGQVYGFLGPNGAGKSTTMNIMTGCLAATDGQVTIDGYDIFEDSAKAKALIGYLPEQPPLYMDSTPAEYLDFVARAKGIPAKELKAEVERVMEQTQITEMRDRLIKHLSKGYKQRVGIAQALLGNPKLIILDEPTVGLDPRQIIEIRELIASLGKEHTVVLSSHILSEVQAVCDNIMIISHGKMVAMGTAENLEDIFAGRTTVTLTADAGAEETEAILSVLPEDCGIDVKALETEGAPKCDAVITSSAEDPDAICRQVFFAFAKAGRALLKLGVERASLEDVFIELTGDQAQEAPAEAPDVSAEAQPSETEVDK